MPIDAARVRGYLKAFDFRSLFIEELGWDRPNGGALEIEVEGRRFRLEPAVEKRGVQIFVCPPGPDSAIPDYPTQRKIEKAVAKLAHEHLIIFTDGARTTQVWQWVARAPGRPAAYRHHTWHTGQSGDALIEKLKHITFTLDDEESLTLSGTTLRLKDAFDRERLTKRFYELFKSEHETFLGFIEGLESTVEREWYASIMLNRLMFIYFIQKKGFLDNNVNYLRDKLAEVQARHGKGKFHSFYRKFLLRLFHEGLGKHERDRARDVAALIGKVPYLNGGLFDVHELERVNNNIEIPDNAFERIFNFFEAYQWHLDDRPLANDQEINPDVLGYIFEKYINQKQMGAYYTKEDITEYITKNTVIPFLLDTARGKCKIAFEGESSAWKLLSTDPDRYIYEAVQRGVIDSDGKVIPENVLPDFVQKGMRDPKARMFDKRFNLGEADIRDSSGRRLALPTETWREYVARRERCLALRDKLRAGKVKDANDLITLNLNIRQFAQDVIESAEGPELVRAFWHAIVGRIPKKSNESFQHGITVLDPTCGSGAFLFAALNILEELYEACLDRMEAFVSELKRDGKQHAEKYADFRDVLAQVAKHPSRKYYIYKTIILNNLYGVDIMPEAVEIAKLRLFLKLVAQLERADQIEPLPDIDFNIRAGNTLVGYTTEDDVRKACQGGEQGAFDFGGDYEKLRDKLETLNSAFELFRRQQTEKDGYVTADDKRQLRDRLRELEDELNRHLAGEYGVDLRKKTEHQKWLASHQPFHWFIEFFSIMRSGGFGVIVGNPPYVELNALDNYRLLNYQCMDAGNLYALVLERCSAIGETSSHQGFIVPVSSVSTDRYVSLQNILTSRVLHFSSFDDRPSRLFDGLEHIRLTIHVIGAETNTPMLFSSRYNKWNKLERDTLFDRLVLTGSKGRSLVPNTLPKLSDPLEISVLKKLETQKASLSDFYVKQHGNEIYYSRKVGYFLQALNFTPEVRDGRGKLRPPSEFKAVAFKSKPEALAALACLNSNLFYWFITVFSDCRHVNKREVDNFPIALPELANGLNKKRIIDLCNRLMKDINKNSKHRPMVFRHDRLTVQTIFPKLSKSLIDEIDTTLAEHYGFSDAEVDFLINYDIKYRMGRGQDNDDDE